MKGCFVCEQVDVVRGIIVDMENGIVRRVQ